MKKKLKGLLILLTLAAMLLAGCAGAVNESLPPESRTPEAVQTEPLPAPTETPAETAGEPELSVIRDGEYTSREEVALYIHQYGCLPGNYITKKQAQALGWVSKEGNLWEVAPGKSIGGDRFGNYEGNLPEAEGRQYYECDIDFDGAYRNAKRILYSNDGLIFYTDDHYKTFTQLYGEEEE